MDNMFRLLISSGAKTRADIEKEVRRVIRDKINQVVKDAIDDAVEGLTGSDKGGEKIPPRQRGNVEYAPRKRSSGRSVTADELAYSPDSSYEDCPELSAKISEMRSLSAVLYNGYMLRQSAELTLVRQGEFMKDVTDDCGRNAFCAIERPIYGAMSTSQLRTYFTWRTDVRRGVYNRVDKPYVILYCYELLNKIGVLSAEDAFNRLLGVWENCRGFCPPLDSMMPRWLKDLYAFNRIEGVSSVEDCFPVKPAEDDSAAGLLAGDYSDRLEYMAGYSSYNIKGSVFLTDDTVPMLNGALEAALKALDAFFAERDISLAEIICGKLKKDHSWTPFAGAFVDLSRMDGFHACKVSGSERYCVKRGQPCLERFEYAPYRSFIGYLLKSVECCLRQRTGFRYKLTPNITPVLEDFRNRDRLMDAVSSEEFPKIIPDAVNRWCDARGLFPPKKTKAGRFSYAEEQPAAPVKVEIDVSKLAQIRRESDEIAQKLILEEEAPPAPEQITELTERIEADTFEERAEEYYELSEDGGDVWQRLGGALSEGQLAVLRAVLNGTAEELCRSMGVLPQTAFEELNAAALEHIGDVIIEDGGVIPDYAEELKSIAGI